MRDDTKMAKSFGEERELSKHSVILVESIFRHIKKISRHKKIPYRHRMTISKYSPSILTCQIKKGVRNPTVHKSTVNYKSTSKFQTKFTPFNFGFNYVK